MKTISVTLHFKAVEQCIMKIELKFKDNRKYKFMHIIKQKSEVQFCSYFLEKSKLIAYSYGPN